MNLDLYEILMIDNNATDAMREVVYKLLANVSYSGDIFLCLGPVFITLGINVFIEAC